MYFICACMHVTTQLEFCLHEQTQIVANTTCIVTYFLTFLWSLLPFEFLFTFNYVTEPHLSTVKLET